MPIQNNLINFYYVKTNTLPTNVDNDGIYFVEPTGELYVGSVLIANKSDERIKIHTVAEWKLLYETIAEDGVIYVYSDYRKINGKNVPGFKIGDGTSYLIDMPFSDEDILDHINNQVIHITNEGRIKWNGKASVSISKSDNENLVFTEG